MKLRLHPFLLAGLLAATAGQLAAQEFHGEMIATTLVENGAPVRLELIVFPPARGTAPFPTVVFNHGSTGTGSDPALFTKTWVSFEAARFFTARGWMVVFPQRRGRGKSDGLYDEGFTPNRSGYTCEPARSLAGLERALVDLDEVVRHLRTRADVDPRHLLIAGQSRGGILAVTYAGTRPAVFLGAVNFVGGWMSDTCPNPTAINTVSFARGGASPRPTLWLYAENDSFYRLSHSRQNFSAFTAAGGQGHFQVFTPAPGVNGHFLIDFPAQWADAADDFLATLPRRAPTVQVLGAATPPGPDQPLNLGVAADGERTAHQWFRDGAPLDGATAAQLTLPGLEPATAGLYAATVTAADGTTTTAAPHLLAPLLATKTSGTATEVLTDVLHPNRQRYDQVLLTGPAAAVTADPGQVVRLSYLDPTDDIVQVEFSGAGTLTLTLAADPRAPPAPPLLYHQPTVAYPRGHATLLLTGADKTTNLSVFTVGRLTAFDPTGAWDAAAPISATNRPENNGNPLFRADATYDGVADLAFLAISSPTGRFGGVRAANAHFSSTRGFTGLHAPGIRFSGPVFVGDLTAAGEATPVLLLGGADDVRITGGDLRQANARAVQLSGITTLRFTAGVNSHGLALPAQANLARLEQAGVDVTAQVARGP